MYQADSFKMSPEPVKQVDSLEHLLGLSGEEAETRRGLLVDPEEGGAGDRLHHLLSSHVTSHGQSLDSLQR